MHELSLAQSILDQVAKMAGGRGIRVLEIGVGELMQVDRKAFEQAVKVLMSGPGFEGAALRVRVEKASFSCRRCGSKWKMADVRKQLSGLPDSLKVREPEDRASPLHFLPYLYTAFVRCPKCGSSDIYAGSGKELVLRGLILK